MSWRTSINRFIYGPTAEERVREWQSKLRSETRSLDREINSLKTAADKTKATIKQYAKKGDIVSAKLLAREIVRTDKHRDRLIASKSALNNVSMQLQNQLATVKITGILSKSSEVMKMTNNMVNLPKLSASMQQVSREMIKAGIIEEMTSDVMDLEEDGVEEEADEEVEKILWEITQGKLGQAGSLKSDTLPADEVAEADDPETQRVQRELDALLAGS